MRKQSGPPGRVKTAVAAAIALPWAAALAGCADGAASWYKAGQSAAATRSDLAACERDAEELTLAGRGQSRSSYGPASGGPMGAVRDDPLAMHDRSEAAADYRKAVSRCMSAAGYSHDAAAARANR
jgi:hypothetical protein